MNITNYDTSSSGVNLELLCFYDNSLARLNCEEALTIVRHSSYRSNPELFYTGFGEYEYSGSLRDYYTTEGLSSEEVLSSLLDYTNCNSIDELTELYNGSGQTLLEFVGDWFGSDETYEEYAQEYLTLDITTYEVRGYSQGEYAKVYVPKEFADSVTDEYLTNLLFDAPIYCRLTINGDEVYPVDIDGEYLYWDKDKALEAFKKALAGHEHYEYIIDWLDEELPIQLEYK